VNHRLVISEARGQSRIALVRIEAPQTFDYQNKYFTDDLKYFCPWGSGQKSRTITKSRSRASACSAVADGGART
jgi:hypothetical protein